MKLYHLFIEDIELSYENYKEEFDIGIFSTYDTAYNTCNKYISEISGFKDYPCKYRILEKTVIDCNSSENLENVYVISGWNVNENLDEIDIIESECYASIKSAENELNSLKSNIQRDEWYIKKFKINQKLWSEGFKRA